MKKNQFCRKSAFRKRENFSVFFLFAVFRQFSEIIWKTVEEKKNDQFNAPTRQRLRSKSCCQDKIF